MWIQARWSNTGLPEPVNISYSPDQYSGQINPYKGTHIVDMGMTP